MLRRYEVFAPDPLVLAREFGIPINDIAVRLDVTSDWVRRLARDARHAPRVRLAVLQLALERERLQLLVGA